jgi:hypothetical protein
MLRVRNPGWKGYPQQFAVSNYRQIIVRKLPNRVIHNSQYPKSRSHKRNVEPTKIGSTLLLQKRYSASQSRSASCVVRKAISCHGISAGAK